MLVAIGQEGQRAGNVSVNTGVGFSEAKGEVSAICNEL